MKKLILICIILVTIMTSCSTDGFDDVKCAKAVKEYFPNCKVYVMEPHYKYLVVDSLGKAKLAVCGSRSFAKVTSIEEYLEIK